MQATPSPSPFFAADGFSIAVSGGTPPYEFAPLGVPPNPTGVEVTSVGPPAHVDVPEDTPRGTTVYVLVTDSSNPPQTVIVANRVA
jgi:hypothetical protein